MEVQEITKEVEIYQKAISTFGSGTAILQQHQLIASKAEQFMENLLNEIQANGGKLNEALDKRCNDLIAKCNGRKKDMEESRKEVTQLFDVIKKMFISEEAKMDIKKDSKVAILQQFRNEYATMLAQEAKRKQQEAANKAAKENELISIKSDLQNQLNNQFTHNLNNRLDGLRSLYRSLSLENFASVADQIKNYDELYSYELHNSFNPSLSLRLVTKEESVALLKGEMAGVFNDYSAKFKEAVEDAKIKCIDLLNGRKKELEEIAQADAASAERMKQEAADRAQREEEEAKRKLEEQAKAEQDKIESQKAAAEMDTLFNQSVEAQVETPQPESRAGYEIEVTNRSGWMLIFQLWFKEEGAAGTDASMEKKTLGSMKKFCEKHAHKTGEKIESKFIIYNEVHTAINRK